MAAHRYWRVKVTTIGNMSRGCAVAADIKFYDSDLNVCEGVPLATTSGTAFAYDFYSSGLEPANAFDASTNTYWHSSCYFTEDQFVGYDFGADNEKDVVCAAWRARPDSFGDDDSIATGDLQYSDDGVSYTTLHSFIVGPYLSYLSPGDSRFLLPINPSFSDTGGHRYWRANVTTFSAAEFSGLSLVRFIRAGKNITIGGTPTQPAFVRDGGASDVVHQIDNTTGLIQWKSVDSPEQWVGYDFGSGQSVKIDKVFIAPNRDDPARAWLAATLEWSDDGISWTVAGSKTFSTWVLNVGQYIENADGETPPPTLRKRRIAVVNF